MALSLASSIKSAPEIIKAGVDIAKNIKTDFTSDEALKIPAATVGIANSLSQDKEVITEGPKVAKEITVLAHAMQLLSSNK